MIINKGGGKGKIKFELESAFHLELENGGIARC